MSNLLLRNRFFFSELQETQKYKFQAKYIESINLKAESTNSNNSAWSTNINNSA
jgi:hypothetical protein